MSVVVRESLGDPQPARAHGTRKVPWSKFKRSQTLHVPDVKELVRDRIERVFVNAGFAKCARFDDLRRREMFHAVAGMIVSREMNQKRVLRKLRWSPQRNLRTHDLLDVAHELRALAAFRSKGMNDDVKLLAVDVERFSGPVGS